MRYHENVKGIHSKNCSEEGNFFVKETSCLDEYVTVLQGKAVVIMKGTFFGRESYFSRINISLLTMPNFCLSFKNILSISFLRIELLSTLKKIL